MTVYTAKEYVNIFDGGQSAIDRGDYRCAYDHFMACLAYKKKYEPWNDSEISMLERLISNCLAHF
jgi:hypothetical protein